MTGGRPWAGAPDASDGALYRLVENVAKAARSL